MILQFFYCFFFQQFILEHCLILIALIDLRVHCVNPSSLAHRKNNIV